MKFGFEIELLSVLDYRTGYTNSGKLFNFIRERLKNDFPANAELTPCGITHTIVNIYFKHNFTEESYIMVALTRNGVVVSVNTHTHARKGKKGVRHIVLGPVTVLIPFQAIN